MSQTDYYLGTEDDNTITTEGSDPILLYSIGLLQYALEVDWDDDGIYDSTNEADYLLRYTCDRGRDRHIAEPGSGFEPYQEGVLTLTLDNSTGRYNPWLTGGDLYGLLEPGHLMTFRVAAYESTDGDGHTTYDLFTGYVFDIVPNGWNDTATMICKDGMSMLKGKTFSIPTRNYQTSSFATAITDILTLAGYPYDTNVSTGDASPSSDYEMPYVMWSDPNTALGMIDDVCELTLGAASAAADGTFTYRSIYDGETSTVTLTDDILLNDPQLANPWYNKRQSVLYSGYDANVYALAVTADLLSTDDNTILIEGNSTQTYYFPYNVFDEFYIGSAASTSNIPILTANTAEDGTGSDCSTDITFEYEGQLRAVRMDMTNNSSSDAYVEKVQLVSDADNVFALLNTAEFKQGSTSLDWKDTEFFAQNNPFITTYHDYVASHFGAEPANKNRSWIQAQLWLLSKYLKKDKYMPTVQMQGRYSTQFAVDVEDVVTYTSALQGIDGTYRVAGISHKTIGEGTQDVVTTLYLYEEISPLELLSDDDTTYALYIARGADSYANSIVDLTGNGHVIDDDNFSSSDWSSSGGWAASSTGYLITDYSPSTGRTTYAFFGGLTSSTDDQDIIGSNLNLVRNCFRARPSNDIVAYAFGADAFISSTGVGGEYSAAMNNAAFVVNGYKIEDNEFSDPVVDDVYLILASNRTPHTPENIMTSGNVYAIMETSTIDDVDVMAAKTIILKLLSKE